MWVIGLLMFFTGVTLVVWGTLSSDSNLPKDRAMLRLGLIIKSLAFVVGAILVLLSATLFF